MKETKKQKDRRLKVCKVAQDKDATTEEKVEAILKYLKLK